MNRSMLLILTILVFYSPDYYNAIGKPVILLGPNTIYGINNQQVILTCKTKKSSDRIKWIKDDMIIDDADRPFYKFLLTSASEGNYFCNVSNSKYYTVSNKAEVRIRYLNNFKNTGTNHQTKFISPGSILLLECPAPDGLPKPQVTWDANITIDRHRFKKDTMNNLRIDNVKRSDSGSYYCIVSNSERKLRSPAIEVAVVQRPVFGILPKQVHVMVQSVVVFPCLVYGDSPMTVKWFKQGAPISQQTLARSQIGDNCSLVIRDVKQQDKGVYVCQASNRAGTTEIIFKLLVKSYPVFIETPSVTQSMVGARASLKCSAIGFPKPTILWHHNHQFITTDLSDRINMHKNGTLEIRKVRMSDRGKYTCFAASIVGITKSEADLKVQSHTDLFPPVIAVVPHNTSSYEGENVLLQCRAASKIRGRKHFSWYKLSMRIVSQGNPRFSLYKNGDLLIKNLRVLDSSQFTCRLSVNGLYSEATCQLTVKPYSAHIGEKTALQYSPASQPQPAAPTSMSVDYIGDNHLLVSWQSKWAASKYASYQVEIAEENVNSWRVAGTVSKRSMLIQGLKRDTGYRVLIRTVYKHRIGHLIQYNDTIYTLRKPTIGVKTNLNDLEKSLEEIELHNVKLDKISSRQIRVSWSIRSIHPDIVRRISGFVVKTEQVNIKRCLLSASGNNDDSGSNMYKNKLYEQLRYDCSDNSNAMTNYQRILTRHFEKKSSVSKENIRRIPIYRTITIEKSMTSAIIGDLSPFMCYKVEIETFIDHIKAGRITGQDSQSKTILTSYDVPIKSPAIEEYKWMDNDTFLVKWREIDAQYTNGPIIGYLIHLINLETRQQNVFELDSSSNQYKVFIDHPDKRQLIYVSGKSCRGQSPRSQPIILEPGQKCRLLEPLSSHLVTKNDKNNPGSKSLFEQYMIPFIIVIIFVCLCLLICVIIIITRCAPSFHRYTRHGVGNGDGNGGGGNVNIEGHKKWPNSNNNNNNNNDDSMNGKPIGAYDHAYHLHSNPNYPANIHHPNPSQIDQQKLLGNYETIIPMTSIFKTEMDHSGCSLGHPGNLQFPNYTTNTHTATTSTSTNSNNTAQPGSHPQHPNSACSTNNSSSMQQCNSSSNTDSLAYASSSIIYKDTSHPHVNKPPPNVTSLQLYNVTTLPPNYGPFIDVFSGATPLLHHHPSDPHHMMMQQQPQKPMNYELMGCGNNPVSNSQFIPPPPMYPPPPPPLNLNKNIMMQQQPSLDNNHDPNSIFSNSNNSCQNLNNIHMNNTHSSTNTSSGCGSNSNKSSSNKTRLSRNTLGQSVQSSGSSSKKSRKQQSNLIGGGNTSGSSRHDSQNSIQRNTSQNPNVTQTSNVPSVMKPLFPSIINDTLSDDADIEDEDDDHSNYQHHQRLSSADDDDDYGDTTSDANASSQYFTHQNAKCFPQHTHQHSMPDGSDVSNVAESSLNIPRAITPDYSTDGSYPYSLANHYSSSAEPNNTPSYSHNQSSNINNTRSNNKNIRVNMPTKF